MQTLAQSYNSLTYVVRLNADRLLMGAALVAALYASAYVVFAQMLTIAP